MKRTSTARVLCDVATKSSYLEECLEEYVDWAIGMMEQGYSGDNLEILASLGEPFNAFEVCDYRDRALAELRIEIPAPEQALAN